MIIANPSYERGIILGLCVQSKIGKGKELRFSISVEGIGLTMGSRQISRFIDSESCRVQSKGVYWCIKCFTFNSTLSAKEKWSMGVISPLPVQMPTTLNNKTLSINLSCSPKRLRLIVFIGLPMIRNWEFRLLDFWFLLGREIFRHQSFVVYVYNN